MLVRFTVENCFSFRDRVEFSMIAAEDVLDHPEHVIRAGGGDGVPILKLGVIYGANASGKSNLVKAILMARNLILIPAGADKPIARAPFKLDPACRDKPTRFEFEIKLGERCFAYGFAVSSQRVEEEWLFEIGRSVEERIFERTVNGFEWGQLKFSGLDEKAFLEFTAKGTLPNRLFLSECRERDVRTNVPAAADIVNMLQWFEYGLIVALPDGLTQNIALRVYSDENFKRELARYLRCFETGILEIDVEPNVIPVMTLSERTRSYLDTISDLKNLVGHGTDVSPLAFVDRTDQESVRLWKIVSQHGGPNGMAPGATFEMSEESDGTLRLMQLVPAMIAMMKGGGVFVIDELDRSLHADILHSYLANFLKYSVGRSSQLIVTTHDTTLLRQDFLRRDEVWFVEKGNDQSSRLVALEEFKNVDQSNDLQKDYLLGRYGGVPVIRDFSWLGEEHGETT